MLIHGNSENVVLEFVCPFCKNITRMTVPTDEYIAYMNGELAQNAFTSLNASEREVIISHICLDCQERIFGSDEDEEPEEFDYDFADTYMEIGFNPYMGCYDWDE